MRPGGAGLQMTAPAVLQVLPRLGFGGVERSAVDLSGGLVAAGWRSVVASGGGPLASEIERAGGRHVALPLATKAPWRMLANAARLSRLVSELGISIVHARSRAPAWSARAAARRRGVPFVTTFHGLYGAGGRAKALYNSVMAGGDVVISVSDFVSRHVAATYGVAPRSLRRIYEGVDLGEFDPDAVAPERVRGVAAGWGVPDGARVVMLPGRLSRQKGHATLVEAARRLAGEGVFVAMVGAAAGAPGLRGEIEARVDGTGVRHMVALTAPCGDMPAAYMLADVVVMASVRPESFGRVAAEAQAMGRPTVVTSLGPSPEVVADGRTGWLVPPGDPDSLACAVRAALAMTAAERAAGARRARDRVSALMSKSGMCERTLEVYRELLDGGPPARPQ